MKYETDRFRAVSDRGIARTIIILQEYAPTSPSCNPQGFLEGLQEVQTLHGYPVNFIDENTLEVLNDPLHPGLIVRRI